MISDIYIYIYIGNWKPNVLQKHIEGRINDSRIRNKIKITYNLINKY